MTTPEQTPSLAAAPKTDYQVLLIRDETVEYQYGVFCPELPGCVSDGRTRAEALWMIKDAIALYLSVVGADDDAASEKPPPVPIQQLADEYAAAGFPVEIAAVSVGQASQPAPPHPGVIQ